MGRKKQSKTPSQVSIYEITKEGHYPHLHCGHCFQGFHPSTSIRTSGHLSMKNGIWYCSTGCYHLDMYKTSSGPYADSSHKAKFCWLADKQVPEKVIRRRKKQLPTEVVEKTEKHKKKMSAKSAKEDSGSEPPRKAAIEALMRDLEAESPFVGSINDLHFSATNKFLSMY